MMAIQTIVVTVSLIFIAFMGCIAIAYFAGAF
jgi:hypothetical protein